jgi:hypothetical protein
MASKITLFIGEPLLNPELVQHCFKEAGVDIVARTYPNVKNWDIEWCRDQTVARLDGTHLVGFSDFHEYTYVNLALTPLFFESPEELAQTAWASKGVLRSQPTTRKITHFLKENQIPFRCSHCAFDGGNVLLFHSAGQKPRAIVGFNSVIHTFLALKVQNFYKRNKERLQFEVKDPSSEAYYVARNLELQLKYKDFEYRSYRNAYTQQDATIESEYNKELNTVLTKEEKSRLHTQAVEIEKQLQVAKEEIGHELGVEDPIFVPQRVFHIDMELLPLEGKNVVFYHKDREPLSIAYSERIESILFAHGLIAKPVRAIAEIDGFKCNLMNALQIKDVIMLPSPNPLFKRYDSYFREALKKEGKKVVEIPLPRDTTTNFLGGLHCFTFENSC